MRVAYCFLGAGLLPIAGIARRMTLGLRMAYLFLGAGLLLPIGFLLFPGEPAFQIVGSGLLAASWILLGTKTPDPYLWKVMTAGSSLWLVHHLAFAGGQHAAVQPFRLNVVGSSLFVIGCLLMMIKGGVRIIPVLWEIYSLTAVALAMGPRDFGGGILMLPHMKYASYVCALSWLVGCGIMIYRGGFKLLKAKTVDDSNEVAGEHVVHYKVLQSAKSFAVPERGQAC